MRDGEGVRDTSGGTKGGGKLNRVDGLGEGSGDVEALLRGRHQHANRSPSLPRHETLVILKDITEKKMQ